MAKVAAAKSHRGSQGFESMSFSEEQKVINKMWARMSKSLVMTQHSIAAIYPTEMPTGEHSHELLTPRAVEVIQATIKSGMMTESMQTSHRSWRRTRTQRSIPQ